MKSRSLPYVMALLGAVAVLAAVWVADRLEQERFREANRTSVIQRLSAVRARLEGALNARLFLTQGLLAHVVTHPEIAQAEFEALASVLVAERSAIRSIQLAKKTVVTHVYPVEGNEKARGLRLLDLPDQRAAVQRALDTRKTVVAGPVDLVQGGVAFVSRTPIYLTPPGRPPASGPYWGLATILIDKDTLLKEAGLFEGSGGLQYALRGKDGLGAQGEVFFGDTTIFESNPVALDVFIPNGSWQLAAIPVGGWAAVSPRLWLFRIGGALLAIMAAGLAFFATLSRTRLREGEQALRESEKRYRVLYEDNPAMYFTVDSEGTVLSVNQFGAKQLGYTVDELRGQSVLNLFHPDDKDAVLRQLKGCFDNPEQLSLWEFRKVHKDGGVIWVREASRAVRATDGKTIALIVCANITEQKRAGELLRQAHDELELRVEERTALLSGTVAAVELQMAERKRAEEALRQSEERYRAIVEDQTEMICRWLPDATLTFVNLAYARYFGKSPDGLIGQSFFSSIPEEERQAAMEQIKSLGENLSTGSCERRVFTAQDEFRWLHWVDQPILDDDGGVVEFQSVGRDITERKRAEEGLQRSEERFRRVLETAPDGMVLVRPDGTIALANEQMEKLFGYRSEELIGQGVEMLALEGFRTEQVQRRRDAFGDSRDRPRGSGLELYGRRKDGSEVPVEIRLSPLQAPEGVLVCAAIRDVTERKGAEEALRESEARFRTMANTAPVMIWMSGTDKLCTFFNKGWLDFTGRSLEQELGNGWAEGVHQEDLDRCLEVYVSSFDARQAFTVEYRLRRHDGEYCWVLDNGVPRFAPDGTFLGYIGSATDITERKRAEEALQKSEAALRRSQEGLRDLAGKLLTAQEEERRRLARELHDDLTQRLAVLAIEAGRLEQQLHGTAAPVLERLRQMKEQIVKLSADVHGISRQLHPSILDDLGLVSAMESECAHLTQREGIAVKYESHNVPTTLPRDVALCLYRIAQEALRNIAKHAQTTEAFVALVGAKDAITLSVWDDGVGFDPAQVHRKPGLGLASMEERVRLIRGELSVKSHPGRGTEIEVVAPVRRD